MTVDDPDPQRIGRYQVVRLLGSGGTGRVYECLDTALERHVAVKLLAAGGPDAPSRFLVEARAAARLSHPNVAAIHDVGRTAEGQAFVVQELIDGSHLARVLEAMPEGLPAPVATHLLLQVAQALAYAHARGIVHRDVKPGNVMVMANGVAKLLDFGIARLDQPLAGPLGAITVPGTVVGTPQYMSPEQMRGDEVTASTDIYAFGALAYELLSGRKPHGEGNFATLAVRLLQEMPPPLAGRVAGVPPALDRLVTACLAKLPADRPPDMAAVVTALQPLPQAWDPDVLARARAVPPRPTSPHTGVTVVGAAPVGKATLPPTSGASPVTAPAFDPATFTLDPFGPTGAVAGGDIVPPRAPSARGLQVGQRLGRFVLHELISRGKSGDLYRAYDEVRGSLVGVRVVRAGDGGARERLVRGGRIWIKLHHPNIVRVHEVHPDYEGQGGVIVTELVDGLNLDQLVAQRALTLDQAVWIVMQTCDALAAIHVLQAVHREVKPRNIVVSGPELHVTLLDSGIARHENPEIDAFTKTGVFVGDLTYAAPEMALGLADQRSDVYGAAAVLFELVTRSKLPFPLPPDWRPDRQLSDRLPSRLVQALTKGLERDPQRRFASVGELHDQLRPLAAGRTGPQTRPAVVALHGIRTQAAWQRAFLEMAARHGLDAHVDRWNFGYFSVFRFLAPWARLAKVRWFREAYQQAFRETAGAGIDLPSIVAHSFGSYILGNALLRYPYLRFNKVLLCGSILPRAFPWDQLIERGQVQAVRNEHGRHDVWTRAVAWFVPGTGPSGLDGFSVAHPRLEQESFSFEHGEYFERGHMEQRWMPFLTAQVAQQPAQDRPVSAPAPEQRPWGLYALYLALVASIAVAAGWTLR
jgi:serine/threonine-protein kinase